MMWLSFMVFCSVFLAAPHELHAFAFNSVPNKKFLVPVSSKIEWQSADLKHEPTDLFPRPPLASQSRNNDGSDSLDANDWVYMLFMFFSIAGQVALVNRITIS
mmetsp:Transcript_41054/g.60248  ORF Transcript_41054/g.60248 Transcript_41054/m.60248 type:complete len:103 (+) Transcript_41054:67-375(+)